MASSTTPSSIAPDALSVPFLNKLRGRRIILASSSPRRREILASIGVHPEIIASTFLEDLPKSSFAGEKALQYPAETAAHKAMEVYQRLLKEDPDAERPPDLVLAADTVVVKDGEIMEKPLDKKDHARMLGELNGGECQVITGISIVLPTLTAPGYQLHSLSESTDVHFADSPPELLEAYIASGEGLDRAGGFAIQGKGGLLVKRIEGDWNNVVGLPLHSLCTFLSELSESGQLDFED